MNIHSLKDIENRGNSINSNSENDSSKNSKYQSLQSEETNINQENKCKSIIKHCFPGITWKSISFILLLSIIVVYIVDLIVYKIALDKNTKKENVSNEGSIGSNEIWSCVLYTSGSNYPPAVIKNLQIYRLISSIFLHANFSHIAGNIISALFISFYIEDFLESKIKFITMFFVAGLYGNILSGMIDNEKQGVGASGSIFGLYAFLLLVFIFHHNQMNSQRKQIFFYFLLTFIVNFANSFQNAQESHIGVFAHLGGFVAGIILGLFFIDLRENHLFLSDAWLGRLMMCQKIFLVLFIIAVLGSLHFYYNMEVKADYLNSICQEILR